MKVPHTFKRQAGNVFPLTLKEQPQGSHSSSVCCAELIKCMKVTLKCYLGDVFSCNETQVMLSKEQEWTN